MEASTRGRRALPAILIGGLTAGVLDMTYACIFSFVRRGTKPPRVFQSVASGLLGKAAFDGGAGTAALGLLCHFTIATTAAAVYYLASRRLKFMVSRAVPCGILFGLCVYFFMYYVVLPLSAVPFPRPSTWPPVVGGLLIHMFGIGLPIALITKRFSR